MYAELDLKFKKSIQPDELKRDLEKIARVNYVEANVALRGTIFDKQSDISKAVLAAEIIPNVATVIYFGEGDDTIKVHISCKTLADLKKQCSRISRQLDRLPGTKGIMESTATVLVMVGRSEEAVLIGKKIPYLKRVYEVSGEKFFAKFLPAAITFALAASFLPGTSIFQSAFIGSIAAFMGAIIEVLISASLAKEWKWTDV